MGYYNKMNPLNKGNLYTPVDGCGGTYEDKFYVNGMYIDLCGLSVKEYMNNPCCGGNSNADTDNTGTTKPFNEILVKTFTDENGVIFYQAFAKNAVTSELKIFVSATSDIVTELTINNGNTISKAEKGEVLNVIGVTLNINEDETYRYKVILEIEKDGYEIYYNALMLKNKDTFDNSFNQIVIENDDANEITFTIPATDFNYNDLEDLNEVEQFFNDNQYCFVIYLPKELYENGNYLITNYDGSNAVNKFVYNKDLTINNSVFVCLIEKATDDVAAFVPQYGEDLEFKYNITINF